MAADKDALAYRESTCTNLSVSCPYEIIIYSVLKHINTARMHTISRQFIPLIYRSLGKRILSKILTYIYRTERTLSLSCTTVERTGETTSGVFLTGVVTLSKEGHSKH